MLTNSDIINKHFEKKMSGYKVEDVSAFLAEVAATVSQLNRENAEFKRKLDAANKKLADFETDQNTLSQALLNAQRMSETIIKDAQAKADLTVRYAEIRAEKIKDRVKESIADEQKEFERLKNDIAEFRSNLLDNYKKHIELILAIPTHQNIEIQNSEQEDYEQGNLLDEAPEENNTIIADEVVNNIISDNNESDVTLKQQKADTGFKLNLKFDDDSGEFIPADTSVKKGNAGNKAI